MTTTREAALEQALKDLLAEVGPMKPTAPLVAVVLAGKAALALPPDTHSAGYVEGLEAALSHSLHVNILAARPAPQPAADTRDADFVAEIAKGPPLGLSFMGWTNAMMMKARAIIGTATPAPSDKIAEAAIQVDVWGGDLHQSLVRSTIAKSWSEAAEITERECEAGNLLNILCLDFKAPEHRQDEVDAALRALAGKGE